MIADVFSEFNTLIERICILTVYDSIMRQATYGRAYVLKQGRGPQNVQKTYAGGAVSGVSGNTFDENVLCPADLTLQVCRADILFAQFIAQVPDHATGSVIKAPPHPSRPSPHIKVFRRLTPGTTSCHSHSSCVGAVQRRGAGSAVNSLRKSGATSVL